MGRFDRETYLHEGQRHPVASTPEDMDRRREAADALMRRKAPLRGHFKLENRHGEELNRKGQREAMECKVTSRDDGVLIGVVDRAFDTLVRAAGQEDGDGNPHLEMKFLVTDVIRVSPRRTVARVVPFDVDRLLEQAMANHPDAFADAVTRLEQEDSASDQLAA